MGEKDGEKKAPAAEAVEKKAADGGGKKDEGQIIAVLKLDLHCEGCAKKVKRAVSHFEGVEKVKTDCDANKLTVTGNVDPTWLRERVEYKTKKKVELISPQPKKDGGDKKADDKKKEEPKKEDAKKPDDDKKPKEPAVTTVVMKIRLHCDGCAQKIKRTISKNIVGISKVTTNLEKDLVTVTGTMNVKELTTFLKEKLKRSIEVVPPPKKDDGGGEKKDKEGGGEKKDKEGGGDKKEKDGGGDKAAETKKDGGGEKKETKEAVAGGSGEGKKVEVNKLEYQGFNSQTHYAMPVYNQNFYNQDYGVQPYHNQGYLNHGYDPYNNTGYAVQYSHGPPPPPPTYLGANDHMFSDENPNGCSVM